MGTVTPTTTPASNPSKPADSAIQEAILAADIAAQEAIRGLNLLDGGTTIRRVQQPLVQDTQAVIAICNFG